MFFPITSKEWMNVHSFIDHSEFKQAISFFTKLRLPSADIACIDDLYFMEAFIRLLIAQGFQNKALIILERVLSRVHALGPNSYLLLARLLIYKSQIYVSQHNYQTVPQLLKEASESLELLEFQNSPSIQSDYGQIYLLYARLEERVQDWEMYLEDALSCFKADNYPVGEAAALNSFGILFGRLQDYELSRDYFEKGIDISIRIHDLRRLAGCYNNVAVLYYFETEDYASQTLGKHFLEEAITISSKINSWEFLAQHYLSMIQFYQKNHQYRNAIPYLDLLYKVQEKRGILNPDQKVQYQNVLLHSNINSGSSNINNSVLT